MIEKSSLVKEVSLNHMCKIGLSTHVSVTIQHHLKWKIPIKNYILKVLFFVYSSYRMNSS